MPEIPEALQKKRYLNSLHNDDMVIRNLPLPVYRVQSDKMNNVRAYTPTAFIRFVQNDIDVWIPVEIKCSKRLSNTTPYLDIKRNQAIKMNEIGGAFLFCCEYSFTLLKADMIMDKGEEVDSDKLEKPCYRVKASDFEWSRFPTSLIFY